MRVRRTERFLHLYTETGPSEIRVRTADGNETVYDRRVQLPGYNRPRFGTMVVGYQWRR